MFKTFQHLRWIIVGLTVVGIRATDKLPVRWGDLKAQDVTQP